MGEAPESPSERRRRRSKVKTPRSSPSKSYASTRRKAAGVPLNDESLLRRLDSYLRPAPEPPQPEPEAKSPTPSSQSRSGRSSTSQGNSLLDRAQLWSAAGSGNSGSLERQRSERRSEDAFLARANRMMTPTPAADTAADAKTARRKQLEAEREAKTLREDSERAREQRAQRIQKDAATKNRNDARKETRRKPAVLESPPRGSVAKPVEDEEAKLAARSREITRQLQPSL